MDKKELELTAYHEAGHAIIARYYGIIVNRITLLDKGNGMTEYNLGVHHDLFKPIIEKKFEPSFYGSFNENLKLIVHDGIEMLYQTFIAGIIAENTIKFGKDYNRNIEDDLSNTDDLRKIQILIDLNEIVTPKNKLLTLKNAESEVRNIFDSDSNWKIVSNIASIVINSDAHVIENIDIDLMLEAYSFKKAMNSITHNL